MKIITPKQHWSKLIDELDQAYWGQGGIFKKAREILKKHNYNTNLDIKLVNDTYKKIFK